jgi:WD40 repeat protein
MYIFISLRSMSIDYSPTGREFVTGGYDKTVRIFNTDDGRSREVYHSKRMQRCASSLFSHAMCKNDEQIPSSPTASLFVDNHQDICGEIQC